MIKKVTIELKQPLHIGIWNFWVVAETNIFIYPWQFVAALGNEKWKPVDINTNFNEILETVSLFIPKDLESSLTKDKIEDWRLKNIQTYVSTAVKPVEHWAKDESLHEIEYILPYKISKKEDNKKKKEYIKYIGYIDEEILKSKFDLKVSKWDEIYIWWEQKYWFWLCKIEEVEDWDDENFEKLKLKPVEKINNKDILFVKPVFLKVFDKEKGVWNKWVYKGFYGLNV